MLKTEDNQSEDNALLSDCYSSAPRKRFQSFEFFLDEITPEKHLISNNSFFNDFCWDLSIKNSLKTIFVCSYRMFEYIVCVHNFVC